MAGIGPGLYFAQRLLLEQQAASVGLVPCAVGETRISDWQEGSENWCNTVNRTKAALAGATDARLAGLLWHVFTPAANDECRLHTRDVFHGTQCFVLCALSSCASLSTVTALSSNALKHQ